MGFLAGMKGLTRRQFIKGTAASTALAAAGAVPALVSAEIGGPAPQATAAAAPAGGVVFQVKVTGVYFSGPTAVAMQVTVFAWGGAIPDGVANFNDEYQLDSSQVLTMNHQILSRAQTRLAATVPTYTPSKSDTGWVYGTFSPLF